MPHGFPALPTIPVPFSLRPRTLLCAVMIIPALAHGQSAPDSVRTVTLAEALSMATRVSPDLASGQATVRSARAARLLATGEYLPSLGVASSGGRGTIVQGANGVTNGIPIASSARPLDDVFGSGVAVALPVFTGGRRGADRRSANAVQDAADAGLVAAAYDVSLATTKTYFKVLRAAEMV